MDRFIYALNKCPGSWEWSDFRGINVRRVERRGWTRSKFEFFVREAMQHGRYVMANATLKDYARWVSMKLVEAYQGPAPFEPKSDLIIGLLNELTDPERGV